MDGHMYEDANGDIIMVARETDTGQSVEQKIDYEFFEAKYMMMEVGIYYMQKTLEDAEKQLDKVEHKEIRAKKKDRKKMTEKQKKNREKLNEVANKKLKTDVEKEIESKKRMLDSIKTYRKYFEAVIEEMKPERFKKLKKVYDDRFKEYQVKFNKEGYKNSM